MVRHGWLTASLAAVLSACFFSAVIAQGGPERPVVIVPGILGSKLCERASGKMIWGDHWSLANFAQLALPVRYDAATLSHRSCGLIDAVNMLGPWQVHQYDDLINTLVSVGYRKEVDLFVFDYDWRLSNRESARKLNSFIAQKIPSGRLDLVAHSMGGIIAKLWMAEQGGANRVVTLVTLGTPHLGSASTFKILDEGWGFWANLAAHGLGNVRETVLTFPSFYELLPVYPRCCGFRSAASQQPDYFDPFTETVWKRFRWVPASFASDERQVWLRETLHDAKEILQKPIPQGPKVVTIVNSLIPTTWRAIFDPGDGRVVHYISQPGDGTVAQWSAANDQLADARPALTSHQTIFADDASRQVLRWILTKGPQPTAGVLVNIKASLRTAAGTFVGVASASAQIDPPVMEPGQRGRFIVELAGQQEIVEADLSNVRAFLDSTPPSALPPPQREIAHDLAGNALVRLLFAFEAPGDLGSFSATVDLPSIANLSDTALVVPK
jgi:pimeloyl-ACP methyl ester carboxylesterase